MDKFLTMCFGHLHWAVLSKHLIYIFVKLVKSLYLSLLSVWTKCLLPKRAVMSWPHLYSLIHRQLRKMSVCLLSQVAWRNTAEHSCCLCVHFIFLQKENLSVFLSQHGSMDPTVQNICNLIEASGPGWGNNIWGPFILLDYVSQPF